MLFGNFEPFPYLFTVYVHTAGRGEAMLASP